MNHLLNKSMLTNVNDLAQEYQHLALSKPS